MSDTRQLRSLAAVALCFAAFSGASKRADAVLWTRRRSLTTASQATEGSRWLRL